MRLTCPNCGAEYEVPDEVIPASGRDVQCSNCGDTWYQYHPDHTPEPEPDADLVEDEDHTGSEPEPAQAVPVEEDDHDTWSDDDDGWSGDDGPDDDDLSAEPEPEAPPAQPQLRRKPLSQDVKSILQEEAEFENRARAGAGDPLESQPELGLGEPDPAPLRREQAAESRLAKLRAEEPPHEPPKPQPADNQPSRRNLLPDIEEINSTLRRKGDSMRRSDGRGGRTRVQDQRRGFRSSFLGILTLAIVGAILYLQAPRIGENIPALAGPMEAYVAAVDKGRIWLDEQATLLAQKLDAMSDEATPDTQPGTPGTN